MAKTGQETCEEFYFKRIAPVDATVEDYRDFFELLWRTHGETIFKHAYSRLRNLQDARDVCQDVFLRAMRFVRDNPGRIPLKVNFRAWLRVITRNLINDRFRKVLVRGKVVSSDVLGDIPVDEPPEERPMIAEQLEILRRCLEELTERARTMLRLREIEGRSQKEIAAEVGSNPNAVCVALHRARKALRECVGMGGPGG